MLRSPPLFQTRSDPQGRIEGYASVFGGIDSYGDTVAPGAFKRSLQAGLPVMLWSHQQDRPVGRFESMAEDERGLFFVGQVNLKTAAGRDAFEHVAAGDLSGVSIGYTVPPGGAKTVGGVRQLTQIDLREVSLVTLPADPGARITSVKQAGELRTLPELQRALQDAGLSRREAKAVLHYGYRQGLAQLQAEEQDSSAELKALLDELRTIKF